MPPKKKLGTIVVVVLKARNLKDSHTFYKQDPYALIRLGGTGKQTKVDRRGGQHPVWDEELHLPVYEAISGIDQRTLAVSAYAKENKVDELLGEGKVDISDTLKKGEFDDWVKLELNGVHRGDVYLEMTYYSNEPPLARRPSKLSPNDRLWRPPATPPKDTMSPNLSPRPSPNLSPQRSPNISPQPSPRMRPNPNSSPHLHPNTSPHLRPVQTQASNPAAPSSIQPPSLGRQTYVDPTLKNIPFLDVGPSASSAPNQPSAAQTPAPALYSVPSILRPRNAKSSPIPVSTHDRPPAVPSKENDPDKKFRQELADSDAAFAAQLARSEGIDVDRLRAEEADAELARRIAMEGGDEEGRVIPGGWVG